MNDDHGHDNGLVVPVEPKKHPLPQQAHDWSRLPTSTSSINAWKWRG